MNVLMRAKLPKSKCTQTQGSCHLINTSDKSVTTMLVEGGWVPEIVDPCNSGDSKGYFKS